MLPLCCIKICKRLCGRKILNRSIVTDVANIINNLPKENNSFALNIFRGRISEKRIFPFPEILTTDRKKHLITLITPTEKILTEINDAASNEFQGKIDEGALKELWKLGLFGPLVSKNMGGLGLNNTQYARLLQTIGEHDLAIGVVLNSHQINGLHGIMEFGTDEQKAQYLPRATNGEIAGYCVREPSVGSDYHSIKTRATLSADKSHYLLNGTKIFITNGDVCDIMTVFAQAEMYDEESEQTVDKLTAFIVEKSLGGVVTSKSQTTMGMKALNFGEVEFKDVKVPFKNMLGKIGQGLEIILHTMNSGRYAVAALLSGTMRSCIREATEYTRTRVQYKRTIRSFELIQKKLARMAMLQYVAETMAYMTSTQVDNDLDECFVEAAISKCFSTESAWAVCDECLQIMGGVGYMTQTGIEKVVRDVRAFRIMEVSNEILHMVIALSGIKYAQMHSKDIMLERTVKRIGLGSVPTLEPYVHHSLSESAKLASKCVYNFGNTANKMVAKHGDGMDTRQMILSRLSDCTVDIFAMAVVLSRATSTLRQNSPSAEYEKVITQCWCVEASERVKHNLKMFESQLQEENLKRYVKISEMVGDAKGIAQSSPLNF